MPNWSLVKIKYTQEQENGSFKVITETYLIDCVSFTDAEARAFKVLSEVLKEFTVVSITKMKLSDVFHFEDESGEKWYKVKTFYVSIDDSRGAVKEKKIISYMLVNADSIKQAIERIEKSLATMLIPYEITDVILTPILEVYPYVSEEQEE
ncbi:DUF4494 domain-containing protein [Runella sp. SP2]|uniref:DUF4494 domain-containing protein n=1 Tax=Runella sp. SP2 TaxID=2268026 RepID=UPI000F079374|nr:DUF4494 domain-containing protein [Runella sp. SP2]AYQ31354.1 DUF4494 domain-containing protein [Runella sp. SP2]